MQWSAPEQLMWLWLLLPFAALWYFAVKRLRARQRGFFRQGSPARGLRSARALRPALSRRSAMVGGLVCGSALLLMLLSLARPRWGFVWEDLKSSGVDIMVVMDVSKSMRATDVAPSRMERAKRELVDFLDRVGSDRIGIIAFSGISVVQCPLTSDYAAAALFVDLLEPGLLPVGGTAIGDALRLAIDTLDKYSDAGGQGRAIVLVTDGEDQSTEPREAAQLAKQKGIPIYTIGIGAREGAPIPLAGGGFKKNEQGEIVLTRLDEALLSEVARTTGGRYVRSESGDLDLELIYNQGIRATLVGVEREQGRTRVWTERFTWFLWPAWLLLAVYYVVSFRSQLLVLALLVGSGLGSGDTGLHPFAAKALRAGPLKEAYKKFERGEFEQAKEGFLRQEIQNPDDLETVYNRGVAAFKAQSYEEAERAFDQVATALETRSEQNGKAPLSELEQRLVKDARFNQAHAQIRQQQLNEAKDTLESHLERNPGDTQAQENLEQLKQLIEMQKNQQNSGDQQNQKGEQSDEEQGEQDKSEQDTGEQDKSEQSSGDQQEKDQDAEKAEDQQAEPKDSDSSDQSPQQPSEDQQNSGDQDQQQEDPSPKEGEQDSTPKEENGQDEQQDQGKEAGDQEEERANEGLNEPELKEGQPQQTSPEAGEDETEEGMTPEQARRLLRSLEDKSGGLRYIPRNTKRPEKTMPDW